MTDPDLKNRIEAILFAAGRAVGLQELCKLCKVREPSQIQSTVDALKEELKVRNSPLLITAEADGWKMTVGEKHLAAVREITPHTELSKALLETLAVIAWKQPLLQSDVVKIRTSAAYEHIGELLKLGFISKTRQGRSYALKVTGKFFEYFDLPGHEELKMEFEKIQNAAEMQNVLGDQANVGGLQVFTVPPEHQQQAEPKEESPEELGKLEVFDVPEQSQSAEAQEVSEEETAEGGPFTEGAAEEPESVESIPETEPEEIAEPSPQEGAEEEHPETEEPAEESPSAEEPEAEGEQPAEAKPGKSRKLSAALESFADEGKGEWGKEKQKSEDTEAEPEEETEKPDEPEGEAAGDKPSIDEKL